MPFFAAAAGGLAAGASSGIIGGIFGGRQSNAVNKAVEQQRTDLAPFRAAGQTATTDASDLLGLNGPDAAATAMSRFQTSPGYEFQLQQGLRGVDAGAAARGILSSGGTIKGEEAYASGLADQDFGNYYNRLFNLASLGESAAAGSGAASLAGGGAQAQIAGNQSNLLTSATSSLFGQPAVQNALGSGIKSLFSTSGTPGGLSTWDLSGTPNATLAQVGL